MTVNLRAPHPHECDVLTELALRSKSHWPYSEAFLAACREEMTVHPQQFSDPRRTFVVAARRDDDTPIGFLQLRIPGSSRDDDDSLFAHADVGAASADMELSALFVDPPAIGHGVGKLLWRRAVTLARRAGAEQLLIDSDPHAEAFYAAMGAVRVGDVPSGSVPGRTLPRMAFDLTDQSDALR